MDLKSYSNQNISKTADETTAKNNSNMNETDVKRAINHFSKMNNDQLMRELTKHLSKQRAAGREGQIQETIARIRPLLSPEQQQRMDEVLNKVTSDT